MALPLAVLQQAQPRSMLLTESRLKAARSCARYHKLRYLDGYKPAQDAEALRFGSLMHLGLEAWWRATSERSRAAALAIDGKGDELELAKAAALLAGYDVRWADQPYEVLAVEQEFETALVNPETGKASTTWRLAGKIDAILRDPRDGLVYIVEHKTSATDIGVGSDYWKRLQMDGQISVYYEGARSLGYDVAGCIYDVIGKPGLKPLKATPQESRKYKANGELYANQRDRDETATEYAQRIAADIAASPNKYYQRGVVVRLETEMADAMLDVWQLAKAMRENELAGRAPRNPDSCVNWGRICPFFDVCAGAASLEDENLFIRTTPHPELAGAGNETNADRGGTQ